MFPATRWTLVGRAGGGDTSVRPLALAELVRLYAPALRAHLLQALRYDEHRADDLLQGFLADKVLEQRLVGHADPNRGRFRTFLLAALDRYVIDEHRRATTRRRSPDGGTLDVDERRDDLPSRSAAPTDAFDLTWAREVLGEVLDVMQAQCRQSDRPDLWEVFVARYLRPATEDVDPEPHDSLADRLQLDSPREAANRLITAKRMFTRIFKSVVWRYAANPDEIREETADLWRIFSAARG
jgi:RNA polymerase sigma-70 factor (ECF subfamily)